MLRSLYYRLSPKQRLLLRRVVYFPIDLFRKRHELEPPKGYIYTGPGNYIEIGETFFEYFKDYGNIQPNSRILDIGSGIGRMAIPFTTYLNEKEATKVLMSLRKVSIGVPKILLQNIQTLRLRLHL
jgi:hypothetical protein